MFSYLCNDMEKPVVIISKRAESFIMALPKNARRKIFYNIDLIMSGKMDSEIFKKLRDADGIWEIRVQCERMAYRLLSFWDTRNGALVVAAHGFVKKTEKTPLKEIRIAEALKEKYFNGIEI